jgi:hypothetical protein
MSLRIARIIAEATAIGLAIFLQLKLFGWL